MKIAIELGRYKGKRVFLFPVKVTFGEYAAVAQVNHYPSGVVNVIAHSAQEACDLLTDELGHIPCVELEAFGPKGGIAAHRYWGFDRAIFLGMFRERTDMLQLPLFTRPAETTATQQRKDT